MTAATEWAMSWATLSVMATGVAVLLATYWLCWPWRRSAQQPAAPFELSPPWRLAWPWLDACAAPALRGLGWRRRERLERAIERAGLASRLPLGHLVAAQWLAGVVAAATAAGVAGLAGWWDGSGAALGWTVAAAGALAASLPLRWLSNLRRQRSRRMLRELPFLLDMITLCMDAGLNVHGALQQAVERGPSGPLRDEFQIVLADVRASRGRHEALQALADRVGLPAVQGLVAAIVQADTLGMSLGPVLHAQSERQRSERLLRAEQQALEAPVKMLFPLIVFIFPCTFLVLGFPIVQRLLQVAG